MSKVIVMDHPLIQHKIGWLRRIETGSKDFRTLVSEIVTSDQRFKADGRRDRDADL